MKFLTEHGEKIVAAAVLLFCVWFLKDRFFSSVVVDHENLQRMQVAIDDKIKTEATPPDYAFRKAPDFASFVIANKQRATEPLIIEPPAARTVFPEPLAPTFDAKKTGPQPRPLQPFLMPPLEPKAEADHGSVYVTVKLPEKTEERAKLMRYVRLEIQRGADPAGRDMKTAGFLELDPEVLRPEVVAVTPTTPTTVAPKPEVPEPGRHMESVRNTAPDAHRPVAAPEVSVTRPTAAPLPQDQDLKLFWDVNVEPKKTYYYRVRAIGVLTEEIGKRIEVKNPTTGRVEFFWVVQAPKGEGPGGVTKEAPGASGVVLYATPYTDIVSATTPADYAFRFAGILGKVPDPRYPLAAPDYSGLFEVKVWMKDQLEWGKASLRLKPNEQVRGVLRNDKAKDPTKRTVPFDTGYVFMEIKQVERKKEIEEEVVLKDENGNVIIENGLPKKEKRIRETTERALVAFMRETATGKTEEMEQSRDFESRKESFLYYDKLRKEQESRQRQIEDRRKKEAAPPQR